MLRVCRNLGNFEESEQEKEDRERQLRDIEANLNAEFGLENTPEEPTGAGEDNAEADAPLEQDPLYCLACEKAFKTAKAMENHRKSKKHKEMVLILKEHLREEDLHLLDESTFVEIPEAEVQIGARKSKKQKRRQRRKQQDSDSSESDADAEVAQERNIVMDEPKDDLNIVTSQPENRKQDKVEPPSAKNALCKTCGGVFESRTKLFSHLKESGHAILKPEVMSNLGKAKKGKKGK